MDVRVFGSFRFDPVQRLLFRPDDGPAPLGGRAAELLGLLLERRGEVVSKGDLIEAAWPGLAVEESNLSVQIAHLRRLLGPSPAGGDWIVTVQRIGYRFLPEAPARRDDLPSPGPPRIAVLPFREAADPPNAALGSRLAEDVIIALARFRSLTVSARSSSFRFGGRTADARDVARRLGAAYVVEGSVYGLGERLRLALHLIDGTTGATLWGDTLRLERVGAGDDTEDLTGRAAAQLEAQVHLAEIARSHRERADSQQAYDYYLRAARKMQTSIEADNAAALDLYFRAIELQPENVEFLSAAAVAIHHRTGVGWPEFPHATKTLARELSRRGMDRVEVDAPSLGQFGNAMFTADEEDLGTILSARAADMNENSTMAVVCDGLAKLWNGELDEAERRYRRALELSASEPNHRFALMGMGKVAAARCDWEDALRWGLAAERVSPGISGGNWNRIAASAMLGRMDDAHKYLAQYMRIAPTVTVRSIDAGQVFRDRRHIAPLLKALRLAGLPER